MTRDELLDMMRDDTDFAQEYRAEGARSDSKDHQLATLSYAIADALTARADYLAGRFGG